MLKKAFSSVKDRLTLTPNERLLKDTLNDDETVLPVNNLYRIAELTFEPFEYANIMKCLWEAVTAPTNQHKKILKGLLLSEILLKFGSSRCVQELRDKLEEFQKLLNFYCQNRDVTIQIREKAKEMSSILTDFGCIEGERLKARQQREKFVGISSEQYKHQRSKTMNERSTDEFARKQEGDRYEAETKQYVAQKRGNTEGISKGINEQSYKSDIGLQAKPIRHDNVKPNEMQKSSSQAIPVIRPNLPDNHAQSVQAISNSGSKTPLQTPNPPLNIPQFPQVNMENPSNYQQFPGNNPQYPKVNDLANINQYQQGNTNNLHYQQVQMQTQPNYQLNNTSNLQSPSYPPINLQYSSSAPNYPQYPPQNQQSSAYPTQVYSPKNPNPYQNYSPQPSYVPQQIYQSYPAAPSLIKPKFHHNMVNQANIPLPEFAQSSQRPVDAQDKIIKPVDLNSLINLDDLGASSNKFK